MATIQIQDTTQRDNGWSYHVQLQEQGQDYHYQVSLAQSDYQQWSQGQVSPETVIEKAFDFLLEREPATSIMSEFDCAIIRRYFPEVDQVLPQKLSKAD